MSNPIFIFEGLEAATLTASAGSAAGYPTTYLQDRRYDTKWKANADTHNQTLKAQYTAAKSFDSVFVANHNLASIGLASLEIESSNNGTDWASEDSLTSFPDPLYTSFESVSKLYLRLRFAASGGALTSAPEIGLLFMGAQATLPLFSNNSKRGLEADTEVGESMSGLRYGSSMCADREKFALTLGKKTQINESEWLRLVRVVNGREKPFWYCDIDGYWHFIRFDKNYMPSTGQSNVNFRTEGVEVSEERVGIAMQLPGGYTVPAA